MTIQPLNNITIRATLARVGAFRVVASRASVAAGLVPATPNSKTQSGNNRRGGDKPDHDPERRVL